MCPAGEVHNSDRNQVLRESKDEPHSEEPVRRPTLGPRHNLLRTPERDKAGRRMGFSQLDGKRVAIILRRTSGSLVLRGSASYDHRAGRLRVRLQDEPGSPAFVLDVLAEGVEATPDTEYGCDYVIRFGAT
jgi:hypothetical protein